MFIRYAEILINYAEAMYALGDEKTAKEYVNKIRSRESVQMPEVTESGAALLKMNRYDRQIELVFEGNRFFAVGRWKTAMDSDNEDSKKMLITQNTPLGVKTYK